jgi:hypothetical protein
MQTNQASSGLFLESSSTFVFRWVAGIARTSPLEISNETFTRIIVTLIKRTEVWSTQMTEKHNCCKQKREKVEESPQENLENLFRLAELKVKIDFMRTESNVVFNFEKIATFQNSSKSSE